MGQDIIRRLGVTEEVIQSLCVFLRKGCSVSFKAENLVLQLFRPVQRRNIRKFADVSRVMYAEAAKTQGQGSQ